MATLAESIIEMFQKTPKDDFAKILASQIYEIGKMRSFQKMHITLIYKVLDNTERISPDFAVKLINGILRFHNVDPNDIISHIQTDYVRVLNAIRNKSNDISVYVRQYNNLFGMIQEQNNKIEILSKIIHEQKKNYDELSNNFDTFRESTSSQANSNYIKDDSVSEISGLDKSELSNQIAHLFDMYDEQQKQINEIRDLFAAQCDYQMEVLSSNNRNIRRDINQLNNSISQIQSHIKLMNSASSISNGCSPESNDISNPKTYNEDDIFECCKLGNVVDVQKLTDMNKELINAIDTRNLTPLIYSTIYGQKEICEILISQGSDINAQDENCLYLYQVILLSHMQHVMAIMISANF